MGGDRGWEVDQGSQPVLCLIQFRPGGAEWAEQEGEGPPEVGGVGAETFWPDGPRMMEAVSPRGTSTSLRIATISIASRPFSTAALSSPSTVIRPLSSMRISITPGIFRHCRPHPPYSRTPHGDSKDKHVT